MYNWRDVTARTEVVYDRALSEPSLTNPERIRRYLSIGWIVGPLFVLVFTLGKVIMAVCDYLRPRKVIKFLYFFKFCFATTMYWVFNPFHLG